MTFFALLQKRLLQFGSSHPSPCEYTHPPLHPFTLTPHPLLLLNSYSGSHLAVFPVLFLSASFFSFFLKHNTHAGPLTNGSLSPLSPTDCVCGHLASQSSRVPGAAVDPHPVLVHGSAGALHHRGPGLLQKHPRQHPRIQRARSRGRSP